MKALTIYQPWAQMVVLGIKPFEFRGRPAPRSIVGTVIVVHASVRPIKDGEVDQLIAALERGDGSTGLVADRALPFLKQLRKTTQGLLLGAALGTVRVGEAIDASTIADLGDSDREAHHQWAWPLSEATKWDQAMRCKGAQGFWTWPPRPDVMVDL